MVVTDRDDGVTQSIFYGKLLKRKVSHEKNVHTKSISQQHFPIIPSQLNVSGRFLGGDFLTNIWGDVTFGRGPAIQWFGSVIYVVKYTGLPQRHLE